MAMVGSVPAGQYGKAALDSLGLWPSVEAAVVQSENVPAPRSALVTAGQAALGIVYGSDAKAEPGVTVIGEFPADSHPEILYPAALVAPETAAARDFLTYLQSEGASATFIAQGFIPLAPDGGMTR